MTHLLRLLAAAAVAVAVLAGPAAAGCAAEYKAKRDNPLRLDYGVMTLPDSACTPDEARKAVDARLTARGWTLLTIISLTRTE